jgi:uncharacterized protein YjdB
MCFEGKEKIMKPTFKKAVFSVALVLMLALSALLLFSCSGGTGGAIRTLSLSKVSISFSDVGESADIFATVIEDGTLVGEDILRDEVKWTTSDGEVAIVENGKIIAVGYGTCVVRATYKDASATCNVTNPNPRPPLSISEHEISIDNIGGDYRIFATSDSGADISSEAVWKTSNKNIAVCEDGIISAVGYGSCTVTVIYNQKTAVCTVTVKNPTAPAITLSESSLELALGQSYILDASLNNDAGTEITWKSTNPSVAVCFDGVVTVRSSGTCAILAYTELGYGDVCLITAGGGDPPSIHSAYLDFTFKDLGKTLQSVDLSRGQISSAAVVIGHKMKTLLLEDGRLVVEIALICVKTYDIDGLDGTNSVYATASLYREGDVFCDKKIYKEEGVKVGDVFEIDCAGFTVQTRTDGTAREFYMTFSASTER